MKYKHPLVAGVALALALCSALSLAADNATPAIGQPFSPVDTQRIINADSEPHNWMAIGRDYREQFYSPLEQINEQTVGNLGLAWVHDLDTNRGQEAAPLVVDGIMYFSTAWSKVRAVNARTGELIWAYDPKADPVKVAQGCCDAVNRGIAFWEDKVYVASMDGRLIALNSKTGEVVWDVMTIPENTMYTSTGAPRAAKGLVFIGNAGAEYGTRGYVTAYDAETGEQKWRFYTVPGDPSKPQENPALEKAVPTWTGEWWKIGGGGTVWDAIVYDPELDQLYLGVGNGGPHNPALRSPEGGDNLYLSSIVALDPDTGEYLWHFQQTPGDAWDFTATQPMVLADLEIDGQERKVLMQAPKNGFFYVIDRETGEFISGEAFAPLNWADGLDENGRALVRPEARYYQTGKPFLGKPGPGGAHNWQPMAYHPGHGLVYIPVTLNAFVFTPQAKIEGGGQPEEASAQTGMASSFESTDKKTTEQQALMAELEQGVIDAQGGHLLAWDPVAQEPRWKVEFDTQFNSGTLATAGNLVFAASGNGEFAAFKADTGEKVWSYETDAGIVAAPSTFSIDGEQYVSVIQGWGGGFALISGDVAQMTGPKRNISRVLTFKLGADEPLPEVAQRPKLDPPPPFGDEADIAVGAGLYVSQGCRFCHGPEAISGGTVPDLRHSPMIHSAEAFRSVLHGALLPLGMPPFNTTMSDDQMELIRAYVVDRAHAAK